MLEGRIAEYLSDPFYADIEVFFDLYWHRNDPIPSCDPKDITGFQDGNDGYYYLSEPCVQYAIRCRAEDNAALHLPANAEKIIQRYHTTKWDYYQMFSLLSPFGGVCGKNKSGPFKVTIPKDTAGEPSITSFVTRMKMLCPKTAMAYAVFSREST